MACKADVSNYDNVLKCHHCEGPVVYIEESYIESQCMVCLKTHCDIKSRMCSVTNNRLQLEHMIKYFDSFNSPQNQEQAANKLIELMNTEKNEIYNVCKRFQNNLKAVCQILSQMDYTEYACYYALFQIFPPFIESDTSSDLSLEQIVEKVKEHANWLNMFVKFFATFDMSGDSEMSKNDALVRCMEVIDHHYGHLKQYLSQDLKFANMTYASTDQNALTNEQSAQDAPTSACAFQALYALGTESTGHYVTLIHQITSLIDQSNIDSMPGQPFNQECAWLSVWTFCFT